MILVDTSIWVDHLRSSDRKMEQLLDDEQVAMHPFVLGEIALGYLNPRESILDMLQNLPQTEVASNTEVLQFIERYELFGSGLGYVDVHLLAGVALTFCGIWTRDKRLGRIALSLGIAAKGLS